MVVALLAPQAVLPPVVTPWWTLTLLLWGIWAVRRAPTVALLVLLPGLLLTSCTPPVTLSPALQARVVALADRLAGLPVDPETGEPGATALLAAWRERVSAPSPAASHPPLWAPDVPEEVSNVP
jgi:hypothetical protein